MAINGFAAGAATLILSMLAIARHTVYADNLNDHRSIFEGLGVHLQSWRDPVSREIADRQSAWLQGRRLRLFMGGQVRMDCDALCNAMERPTHIVDVIRAFMRSTCFIYGSDAECCDALRSGGGTIIHTCSCAQTIACSLDPFGGQDIFRNCSLKLPECPAGDFG